MNINITETVCTRPSSSSGKLAVDWRDTSNAVTWSAARSVPEPQTHAEIAEWVEFSLVICWYFAMRAVVCIFKDLISILHLCLHMYVHVCVWHMHVQIPIMPFFSPSVAEQRRREASTESISLKVIFPLLRFVLHVTPSLTGPLFSANLALLSSLLAPLSSLICCLWFCTVLTEGCDGQCLYSQRPTYCVPRCSFY